MRPEKKIHCPRCDSSHTDRVSFVYSCARSDNAGHKLFVGEIETELAKKQHLSAKKKQEILIKFKPPQEAKVSFPALTVALMAFLISWIVTGSFLMTRMGETFYFYTTAFIVLVLAYPFYSTMNLIIGQVRKNHVKYIKEKTAWVKKYYCYDCEAVFTPPEPAASGPAAKTHK